MLPFSALLVLFIIAIVLLYVFKKEYVVKKKVQDFPVKFPEDKDKVQYNILFVLYK